MSDYLNDWWEGVVRECGFRPLILQGSWMERVPGGGADASAGFHDKGGPLDVHTKPLTSIQKVALILAVREGGGVGWIRDEEHGGFEEHGHLLLGSDFDLSTGSAWQWLNYIHGGDGLDDGSGRDYHPRPDPLVITPPGAYLEGLYDMTEERLRQIVREEIDKTTMPNPSNPTGRPWKLTRGLVEIWQRTAKAGGTK